VIERRCVRDVAYRVIAGGLHPDHATIARFRARHETALGELFSQVLRLLAAEGMVSLGTLSLDGTKLAGNAAQKANRTLPGQCRDQLAAAGIRPRLRTVLADSGYISEENFARAGNDGLRLLAPLAKDPGRPGGRPAKRARHLDQYPATTRAIRRMRHPRGPEDYKLRARTVEPVFGQLKTCQKLTMMSRRGLPACENEWLLACAAHNLRKLHRHRLTG
jgi:hypothetical protein